MPMDHDDNDFQGQNLNLAGEGSLTFSSVSRPFAIPKFDFDESLQGHLRFDSLVDNEVFLGIPSEEDNQWIEDFSRGNSGIEFDSAATEPCSISRHNVWSEATSSESVEMLLKSVGQEERVVRETIIEESNGGDESGNLSNPMESNSKQDEGKNHAKHSASAPDVHVSVVGVDHNLHSEEVELSSSELGSKSENREGKNDPNGDDVNHGVIDNVVNENVNNEMPDQSVSKSDCGNTDTSQDLNDQNNQQLVSEIDVGNANRFPEVVWRSVEKQDIIDTRALMDDQKPNAITVESNIQSVVNSLTVTSKLDFADSHIAEMSISDVEVSTSSRMEGCGPQTMDGYNVDMSLHEPSLTSKPEVALSCNLSEINQQVAGNTPLESTDVIPGGGSSRMHAIEVDHTSTKVANHPELEMDSRVHSSPVIEKANAVGIGGEEDKWTLVSSFATSMLSVSDNTGSEPDNVNSNAHVSDSTIMTTACPADDELSWKSFTEKLKVESNAHEVVKEKSNSIGYVIHPILSGSVQIHQENPSFELDETDVDLDVSPHESGSAKLSRESSDMECDVIGALDNPKKPLFVSSIESSENIVLEQRSESDTTAETEPAMGEINFKSHEATDIVIDHDDQPKSPILGVSHQLLDDGMDVDVSRVTSPSNRTSQASTDIVIDYNDQPKSSILGVSHQLLDDKEGMDVVVPRVASPLNGTLQVSTVPHSVSEGLTVEVKEGTSADCAGKVQHEMDDHCASVIHGNHSEQAAVAIQAGQGGYKEMDASSVPCGSSMKEGTGNPVETKVEINDRVQHLSGFTDNSSNNHQASVDSTLPSKCGADHMVQKEDNSAMLDKHDCDSPTVISCVELSHGAKDNHEQGKDAIPCSEVTDNVEEKMQSISQNLCENVSSKEERGFTFEVSPAMGLGDAGRDWQSFSTIQASSLPMIADGSAFKSVAGQVDPKMAQEVTQCSLQAPAGGNTKAGAKGTTERKGRQRSGRKETAKKGINLKESSSSKQSGKSQNLSSSLATTGTGQVLQFEELKSCDSIEPDAMKPSRIISLPASSLPDLNTSVSLFQQPFTDMQQVQLRAQILVYGSLIQGTTPDEAWMIASFGPSDGARSLWEPAWRSSIARLHGQKSQANKSGTPVESRSESRNTGITTPDQAVKHGSATSAKSKVRSSTTGRTNKKGAGTPSPVINSMIPLSSPLWNISTPSGEGLQSGSIARVPPLEYQQTLSPLHPYQTSPIQNFIGQNPSWLSQGPFPVQRAAAPPTSPFNISGHMSTFPFTEAIKLTPVKESGGPVMKHTSSIPVVYAGGSSVFTGTSPLPELTKPTVSSVLPVGDSKSRKRKKVPTSESVGQIPLASQTKTKLVSAPVVISDLSNKFESHGQFSLPAQNRTESVPIPVASSIFSPPVALSTNAGFNSKSTPVKLLSAVTPTPSNNQPKTRDQNAEEKVILSEEAFNKVEEAKVLAEEAAKYAASAISHCHSVWSQLETQKNFGLVSDAEARLASAAVSIAAAASVAKAAAAAAKIASDIAEQARLMADQVLVSSGSEDFSQSRVLSFPNATNDYGKATPASILKSGDGSNRSSSIIVAVKEASRRRVEAASTASKHAENLDAIVRAAELAAEAVSQAGKIVAMGELLPLSKLVASGPEGYWKTPQLPPEQPSVIPDNVNIHESDTMKAETDSNVSVRPGPSDVEIDTLKHGMPQGQIPEDLIKKPMRVVDGILVSKTSHEKELGGLRTHRDSDMSKTIGDVPESESGSHNTSVSVQNENKTTSGILDKSSIKEGCLVEVFKVGGKFKGAWFAADVLNLKDGKAYLCYTELESDEGKLKEWVALEGDGTMVPRIRIAHPMTTMKLEGTRKRRRGVVTDYSWNVGDRVDAWLHNCWCEGIITEKDKSDETSLMVHFPAQGETSAVRAWFLRPTLIWKDEKWIEWSSSKGDYSSQGDTPKEKRIKLSNPFPELRGKQKVSMALIPEEKQPELNLLNVESQGKDKIQTSVDHIMSGKHEEAKLLPLSTHEKLFNVGKITKVENKPGLHRTVRSGLQKEGPRVIFGVPKPGKNQKFMEVSKHYSSDRGSKNASANDSSKLTRNLMPQATGPRGWTNNFKNDNKEKQTVEKKPQISKCKKAAQNPSGRTLAPNDKILSSEKFALKEITMTDNVEKNSSSNDQNDSGQQNLLDFKSSSNNNERLEGPLLASSHAPPADDPKRVQTSKARSDRSNRGRLAPAGGNSAKQEVNDNKPGPEVSEPRRSNRKMQPTSRLLEGLQSSLTITKVRTVSHDKSRRGQTKATPRGK